MDTINFQFNQSVFKNLNPEFWNNDISAKNKTRKHLLSDNSIANLFIRLYNFLKPNVFVFTTDAWHLFKTLHTIALYSIIVLSFHITENIYINFAISLVSIAIKKLIFELSYNRLFKDKASTKAK